MSEFLFLGALGGASFILFAVAVVFYVLKSIGLAALAAGKGIENAWLAWIPVADLYIAGSIVEEMTLFGFRIPNLPLWVPVIFVGAALLGNIPVLGFLILLATLVFSIAFFYILFSMYSNNALLYTLLSVILCLLPVFLFVIRNQQPIRQGPEVHVFPPSV